MGSKKEPKSWACLVFTGPKLKIDWVTQKMGIEPDFVLDKDTLTVSEEPAIPLWQLNSTLPAKDPLNSHLWELLTRIAPSRKELKEISAICDACFYVSVEFASEKTEGIRLEKRTLLLLGDLGISLEIQPWNGQNL